MLSVKILDDSIWMSYWQRWRIASIYPTQKPFEERNWRGFIWPYPSLWT